jgi:hypothetical protein
VGGEFTGSSGEPLDPRITPRTVDEVVAMIARGTEPRSVVLRLEHLLHDILDQQGASARALPSPFAALLEPFLPLAVAHGTTAHIYLSSRRSSALENHTDTTEIAVLQLLGSKEWLYCTADEDSRARRWASSVGDDDDSLPPFMRPPLLASLKSTLPAKLSKCATYNEAEMEDASLACERVATAPGDVLFLPRRTVHSARATALDFSAHLTIGLASSADRDREENDDGQSRRRLNGCATGCDPSCDDASCDDASCDDMSCDDDSCNFSCDGGCTSNCDWFGSSCDGSCNTNCNGCKRFSAKRGCGGGI